MYIDHPKYGKIVRIYWSYVLRISPERMGEYIWEMNPLYIDNKKIYFKQKDIDELKAREKS